MSASRIIRKITIGNYKSRESMHFQVGNPIGLRDGDVRNVIERIVFLERNYVLNKERVYEIYLEDVKEKTIRCWKEINVGKDETCFIEYSLDF